MKSVLKIAIKAAILPTLVCLNLIAIAIALHVRSR